jgi:hypothetical protein
LVRTKSLLTWLQLSSKWGFQMRFLTFGDRKIIKHD